MYTNAVLYGLICMFTWGVINFSVGRISSNLGNFKTSFIIQVLSVFPMLLLSLIFKVNLSISSFFILSLLGITTTFSYLSLTKGYTVGAVSIVTTAMSSWALFTTVLSFTFLEEEITLFKVIGILICFTGMIIISTDFSSLLKDSRLNLIAGAKWGILSAVGIGIQTFLIALFSRSIDWFSITFGWRIWTGIIFLVLAMFLKKNFRNLTTSIPISVIFVVILDVFVNIIFNIGLSTSEPSILSTVASTAPAITVLLSAIVLKERLSLLRYLGIGISLIGIVILSYA